MYSPEEGGGQRGGRSKRGRGEEVSHLGHVDGVNETKDVGRLRTGLIQNNKTTVPEQNRYRKGMKRLYIKLNQ